MVVCYGSKACPKWHLPQNPIAPCAGKGSGERYLGIFTWKHPVQRRAKKLKPEFRLGLIAFIDSYVWAVGIVICLTQPTLPSKPSSPWLQLPIARRSTPQAHSAGAAAEDGPFGATSPAHRAPPAPVLIGEQPQGHGNAPRNPPRRYTHGRGTVQGSRASAAAPVTQHQQMRFPCQRGDQAATAAQRESVFQTRRFKNT